MIVVAPAKGNPTHPPKSTTYLRYYTDLTESPTPKPAVDFEDFVSRVHVLCPWVPEDGRMKGFVGLVLVGAAAGGVGAG